jgi:hypothetical protein
MPIASVQYYLLARKLGVTLEEQVSVVNDLSKKLPLKLKKAVGALPFFLVYEPANFIWYYPSIFADLNMDFLVKDLSGSDIVFYDANLYLLAPLEFKKKLFTEWNFAGRYYLPFANQGSYQPVSIYLRDKGAVDKIYRKLNEFSGLKVFKPELRFLDSPIYMPVYFRAVLKDKYGERVLPKGKSEYRSLGKSKIYLEIIVSTDYTYFEEITNSFFPQRSQIGYSYGSNSVLLSTSYKEQVATDKIIELGLRSRPNNNPTYRGTINIGYNNKPDKISVVNISGGYVMRISFVTDNLQVRIESAQVLEKDEVYL